MIKFGGISFLQLLINHYSKFDFDNIYILAGYKGSIIKKNFIIKYKILPKYIVL